MNHLFGVPAQLKTLLDRLTATRATKLDNLNDTVTSRAPASTALSTATWSATKAGYVDTTISSRAPSSTALSTATWTSARAAYLDAAISSRASAADLEPILRAGGNHDPYCIPKWMVTDQSKIRLVGRSGSTQTAYSAGTHVNFWTYLGYKGAIISTMSVDTWTTVFTVGPGGYRGILTAVVGPYFYHVGTSATITADIRITVDGYARTFSRSVTSTGAQGRLGWGYHNPDVVDPGISAPISADEFAAEGTTGDGWQELGFAQMSTPASAINRGFPGIYYDDSCKVEVRASHLGSGTYDKYAGVLVYRSVG